MNKVSWAVANVKKIKITATHFALLWYCSPISRAFSKVVLRWSTSWAYSTCKEKKRR